MQAVNKAQQPWGLLPDPSSSFWPRSASRTAISLSPAPIAAAACSAHRSAVSAIPSLTGTRREATSCTAKNQCRSVLRPLRASAGDSSEGSGATMPATAAAPDETRSERLAAVRNLELALDPEAAAAAELRRRHKEAVELARTGDPEMALACLHSLLVSVCASVTCAVRAVVQQQSIGT